MPVSRKPKVVLLAGAIGLVVKERPRLPPLAPYIARVFGGDAPPLVWEHRASLNTLVQLTGSNNSAGA